jgi:hypothetical protein
MNLRKSLAAALALGLLLGAMTPALAGKKKSGSFTASGLPYPHPTDGCLGSTEGVNKTTQPLKTPLAGTLTVTMDGFDGDWDLFVTDADGGEIISSTSSQLTGDPPVEEVVFSVTKGLQLQLVACNFGGGPGAEVKWTLVGK